jgi:exodeoxyribonuclease V alpha subunit
LGHARASELRCRAGAVFALQEAASQGHPLLPDAHLRAQAVSLLGIDGGKVYDALLHAIGGGTIVEEHWDGTRYLALKWLRDAERGVARQVDWLQRFPVAWEVRGLDLLIDVAERQAGQNLSVVQRSDIKTLLREKVGILTGSPGVGKTVSLNVLLRVLDLLDATVLLCAPTGRAAKRMSEATGGREAKTIPRLLEYNPGQGGFHRDE